MQKKILQIAGCILHVCFLLCVCTTVTWAQKHTVNGTVTNAADNKPVPRASVTIVGSDAGTMTDLNGKYSIEAEAGQTITVSFVGFIPHTFTVTATYTVNIALKAENLSADEVVVIGYGTARKSHLTGSISKVANTNLGQIPVSRADQALAGKLAGVQVQNTNGYAGAAPTVKIRGAASITAGTNPLIVIDGYPVPTDLSAIDMNNVESIEVLKDAASAAIYGSRGANGVILITSKKGVPGKTRFGFNNMTGLKKAYRKLDFPTLGEWSEYVAKVNNGELSPQLLAAQKYNVETNPEDVIFRTGLFQNTQINLSGGSETVRYYISGEAVYDKGIVLTNDYKRYGGQANLDIRPNKKWQIGINLTPSYSIQNLPNYSVHDLLRSVATWLPIYATEAIAEDTGIPVGYVVHQRDFDPASNAAYTGINLSATANNNGLYNLIGVTNTTYQTKGLFNGSVRYNFTDALSLRISGGALFSNSRNEFFQRSIATTDPLIQGIDRARASSKGSLATVQTIDLLNENLLNYVKSFRQNDLNVVAGFTTQSTQISYANSAATNFATDEITTLNAGTLSSVSSTKEKSTLASFLFRVNYAYCNKYLLSVSSRWDGSSRFGKNNRWGYFPSISAGWAVSNENFWKKGNTVTSLKLRASYGATGNNNIGNYKAYANVTSVGAVLGDATTLGFNSSFYDNDELGWERSFSINSGIDIGFFQNKVTLSIDAYNATTKNLLLNLPIPAITGSNGVYVNRGEVQNKGIEAELTTRIINNNAFKWTLSVNGSSNRNTLKNIGNSNALISTGDPKRINYFIARVGEPLVQFYGYQTAGTVPVGGNFWPINVNADRIIAKDINNDGVVDENDRVVLGQPTPKFIWGLTNDLRYKNFDLSFVLQGSHGAKVFNADPNYYEWHFTATGTSAYLNLPATDQAKTKYKSESDVEVQDASFIALRNLNIGYSFPVSQLTKAKIAALRIYVSTANLWYRFAKDYTSYNPEGINEYVDDPLRNGYQRGAAPLTRNITFGINVNF